MTDHTKARPDRFDAHDKARPDEITFTLLERDPCAPSTILHWVQLRRDAALQIENEDDRREELRQITNAEMIAFEMQSRLKGDAPIIDDGKSLYSGLKVERDPVQDAIGEMRSAIREADYQAKLAEEKLAALLQMEGANGHPQFDDQLLRAARSVSAGVHEIAMRMSRRKTEGPSQEAFNMESTNA